MEMLAKVRRMHLRDKLSLHESSKRTGLSRNTLRKWLRKPEEDVVAPPRYRRGEVPNKLSPYYAKLAYQAEPPHKQGIIRADEGRRLRRQLEPGHRFHP